MEKLVWFLNPSIFVNQIGYTCYISITDHSYDGEKIVGHFSFAYQWLE